MGYGVVGIKVCAEECVFLRRRSNGREGDGNEKRESDEFAGDLTIFGIEGEMNESVRDVKKGRHSEKSGILRGRIFLVV